MLPQTQSLRADILGTSLCAVWLELALGLYWLGSSPLLCRHRRVKTPEQGFSGSMFLPH
ncbi:hypothetical protein K239x_35490 [Planctomycetes bacterium K23_9]|uniref:Uncharacterized protein n=1 Tax=Stieleria marina TaxID=1930275 RepID=A0A517NWQ8_9BACT|nr:hypothetical protein K239x_35490 [Planctomycetes bacterium K23_9]